MATMAKTVVATGASSGLVRPLPPSAHHGPDGNLSSERNMANDFENRVSRPSSSCWGSPSPTGSSWERAR